MEQNLVNLPFTATDRTAEQGTAPTIVHKAEESDDDSSLDLEYPDEEPSFDSGEEKDVNLLQEYGRRMGDVDFLRLRRPDSPEFRISTRIESDAVIRQGMGGTGVVLGDRLSSDVQSTSTQALISYEFEPSTLGPVEEDEDHLDLADKSLEYPPENDENETHSALEESRLGNTEVIFGHKSGSEAASLTNSDVTDGSHDILKSIEESFLPPSLGHSGLEEVDELDTSSESQTSPIQRPGNVAHVSSLEDQSEAATTGEALPSCGQLRSSIVEPTQNLREPIEPPKQNTLKDLVHLHPVYPKPTVPQERTNVHAKTDPPATMELPIPPEAPEEHRTSNPPLKVDICMVTEAINKAFCLKEGLQLKLVEPPQVVDITPVHDVAPPDDSACKLADTSLEYPEVSEDAEDHGADHGALVSGAALDNVGEDSPNIHEAQVAENSEGDVDDDCDSLFSGGVLEQEDLDGDLTAEEYPPLQDIDSTTANMFEHQPLQNISNNQFNPYTLETPRGSPMRCSSEMQMSPARSFKSPSVQVDPKTFEKRSNRVAYTPGVESKFGRLILASPAPQSDMMRCTPFSLASPLRASIAPVPPLLDSIRESETAGRSGNFTPQPEARRDMSPDPSEPSDHEDSTAGDDDEDEEDDDDSEEETEAECEEIWPTLTHKVKMAQLKQPEGRLPAPISVGDVVEIKLKDRPGKGPDLVRVEEIRTRRIDGTATPVYYFLMHWFWEPQEFVKSLERKTALKALPFNENHCGKLEMIETPDHIQVLSSRFDIRPFPLFMYFDQDNPDQPSIPPNYRYSRIKYHFNRHLRHKEKDYVPKNKCICGPAAVAAAAPPTPSKRKSPSKSPSKSKTPSDKNAKLSPGYNPDHDVQRFCPRAMCRRWIHTKCLEKDYIDASGGCLQEGETFESLFEEFHGESDMVLKPLEIESPRKRARTSLTTSRSIPHPTTSRSYDMEPTPPRALAIFGEGEYGDETVDVFSIIRGLARRPIIRGGPFGVVGHAKSICAARDLVRMIKNRAPLEDFRGWQQWIPESVLQSQYLHYPPPLTGCYSCPYCRGPI